MLRAARGATEGQVIAIVQPHRYTRLQSLFDAVRRLLQRRRHACIVADVYPAGEAPIAGVDKEALAAAINAHGHRHAIALPSPDKLARDRARAGASPAIIVVFLGAGNDHAMGLCAARRTGGARQGDSA